MGIFSRVFGYKQDSFHSGIRKKETFRNREKEVSGMLEKTLKKAKRHGGDPFYEHRAKGIMPEKFEYGMNCFLDRIAEAQGEEVAQKVYEELKSMGGCKINPSGGEDLPGIPILLSVCSLDVGLEAYNNVANKIGIDEKDVFKADKKEIIKLMLEGSDLELGLLQKTGPATIHAILARPGDILLDSEPLFVKAVDFHKESLRDRIFQIDKLYLKGKVQRYIFSPLP